VFEFVSGLLRQLSMGRKLMLIFALDRGAVAYSSSYLVCERFLAIDFKRKELVGTADTAQLQALLLNAPKLTVGGHAGAWPRFVGAYR
jgi:hypothetical protein